MAIIPEGGDIFRPRAGLFSRARSFLGRPETIPTLLASGAAGLRAGLETGELESPLLSAGAGLFGGGLAAQQVSQQIRQQRMIEALNRPFGEALPTLAVDFKSKTGIDISDVPLSFAPQLSQIIRAFRTPAAPNLSGLSLQTLKELGNRVDEQLSGVGRFLLPAERVEQLQNLSDQILVRLSEMSGVEEAKPRKEIKKQIKPKSKVKAEDIKF